MARWNPATGAATAPATVTPTNVEEATGTEEDSAAKTSDHFHQKTTLRQPFQARGGWVGIPNP